MTDCVGPGFAAVTKLNELFIAVILAIKLSKFSLASFQIRIFSLVNTLSTIFSVSMLSALCNEYSSASFIQKLEIAPAVFSISLSSFRSTPAFSRICCNYK